MTEYSTTAAHLICDERTSRRLADFLGENLDPEKTVCSAFEADDGQWQVTIHFQAPPDEMALRELVRIAAGDKAALSLVVKQVAARDWVQESLAGLKPVRAGRFVIHGAHDRAHLSPNDINIEIEAALAFGTGHHGTTRGCLLALDSLSKRRRFRKALDVGTGSGVLAMAAAKLIGCAVVASDIDLLAVRSARANAELNNTSPLIEFVHAAGVETQALARYAPYDLIFANILLGPLTRMAASLNRLAAPSAYIVLSGLLPDQANAALTIYRAQGLVLERRIQLEGWTTLVLRHP
jgi:ribosomal protein L11 methyltransferase